MITFNVYIDEAGDEGFEFSKGSSTWFVLAAAIVEAAKDQETAAAINRIKNRLWPHKVDQWRQPLHWSRLKHPQKRVVIQELVKEDFTVIAVAFEKSHSQLDRSRFDPRAVRVKSPQLKATLYLYASRFLLERVCKFARTRAGRVDIVFENRSSLSIAELRSYVSLVSTLPGPYGPPTMPPGVLHCIAAASKQTYKMLQVADACAGALYNALEPDRYGNVEDSYVLSVGPKFDRVRGALWGYGIKLFPGSREDRLRRSEATYSWMGKI
ncbi:MAG: DUF3800 domain-containing protein [Chloroflexota bacterium]|nr:DUF3800 domain-containing protein [Chloroflexota bacterium]